MKRVAVFCGSSVGAQKDYESEAEKLGRALAQREIELVYGGASIGLMGAVANAALKEGGHVIGVIPSFFDSHEVEHNGLSELYKVKSMHERKAMIYEMSDAFIALPGGIGTLDELCEVLTWFQLDLHAKPVGLLSTNGYYDKFLAFLDHAQDQSFLRTVNRSMIQSENSVDKLLTTILP